MIGQTVAHYRIEERLGSGGMGDVYLAVDLRLDRPVALKFLNRELLDEQAAATRLQREARAIARLSHPNIAVVHELVMEEDQCFLVLEYLHGQSLAERLRRGTVPLDEALRIGIGIARGLAEAHAQTLGLPRPSRRAGAARRHRAPRAPRAVHHPRPDPSRCDHAARCRACGGAHAA